MSQIIPSDVGVPHKSVPVALRPLHVLLVEDDHLLCHVMSSALIRRGHHVFPAGSLQEAAVLLGTFAVDLAICDLGLPDGDGRELLRYFPGHLPPAHTVIISGDASPKAVDQSFAAGCAAHLEKPVDFDELQRTVERLLGRPF